MSMEFEKAPLRLIEKLDLNLESLSIVVKFRIKILKHLKSTVASLLRTCCRTYSRDSNALLKININYQLVHSFFVTTGSKRSFLTT